MNKDKLVLIDGNSIMNRAFYGIMGNKMLTTEDGTYTNAIYGFLAIMFKIIEDLNPNYIAVTFDLKGPTKRHEIYKEYKANRHGMPEELAQQMPIIKDVLKAMNIEVVEKQGYEGDDILGTLAKYGESQNIDVTILSGDRDTFQLASENITIRIPRTKAGKTEIEDFNEQKVKETYGLLPKQLIEVKALQGDSSDNIPGVPGIGEKTALSLIQKYESVENLYKMIDEGQDDLKGKQKDNITANRELAFLSKTLGTIDVNAPIEKDLNRLKIEEWNKEKVLELFKKLRFNKYIEKFNLLENNENKKEEKKELFIVKEINSKKCTVEEYQKNIEELNKKIIDKKELIYYFNLKQNNNEGNIIKSEISSIAIYIDNIVYYVSIESNSHSFLQSIFENKEIKKIGHNITSDYILLKQSNITMENIKFDSMVAAYILNPTSNNLKLDNLMLEYLELSVQEYINSNNKIEQDQLSLFNSELTEEKYEEDKNKCAILVYGIGKLYEVLPIKLDEIEATDLFNNIDMPTVEILSDMQWNGMLVDKIKLEEYGKQIKQKIVTLTEEIYKLIGEEFNINSTKQLGEILFEKLKLPVIKKNKTGYSTDVDVLEKLIDEHPVIEKILEYRQVMKLDSTYVEGLKQYINPVTNRIHSFFHQTITATGRISSTEPNLQNIPTRMELGKLVRKIFYPADDCIYLDADYSQIELRVLASLSGDKNMVDAFKNGEDIHRQAASRVFGIPLDEVTKEQRSAAKAVNFGIVYGISDFGLGVQLGISRKKAKQYIEQYLEEYSGIKKFMDNITEEAKQRGYVETLYKRRRYIPELKSSNYMVRQFGMRAAMNTPIQGTAADIMKIAMIKIYQELKNRKLKSKIVLQVHDEVVIETKRNEIDEVSKIIKDCMQSATTLNVPLIAELSQADNWYDCK